MLLGLSLLGSSGAKGLCAKCVFDWGGGLAAQFWGGGWCVWLLFRQLNSTKPPEQIQLLKRVCVLSPLYFEGVLGAFCWLSKGLHAFQVCLVPRCNLGGGLGKTSGHSNAPGTMSGHQSFFFLFEDPDRPPPQNS